MKCLIVLVLFFISTSSCGEQINDHYAGFIVDGQGMGIDNAVISENRTGADSTITDRNGFFKLKREKGVISHLKVRTPKKDTIITTFDIVVDGES